MLCNGLFADLSSWEEVVLELKESFRLILYNARGQGEGPYPEGEYSLETHTQDLYELIQSYRESYSFAKISLLGLSNGGRIALNFARHYPALVERVAVAATHHEVNPLLRAKLESWRQASLVGGPIHRFETALPWIWSRELLENKPELVDFFRSKANRYPSSVVERLIEGAMKSSVDVQQIVVPVLVMAGSEDVLTPAYESRMMADMIKDSQYLEVRGAHAFLLENFQVIKKPLLSFYQGGSI